MVKNGATFASNVQAGALGGLDSQNHALLRQQYDRPGTGKMGCLRRAITIGSGGYFRYCQNSSMKRPLLRLHRRERLAPAK